MAETNMKELIAEVKKTNILLNQNVEHTEPEPVGADRAIKEEQARDARSAMSQTFSKFLGSGSFVGKALGGLGDKLKGFGAGAKGVLGTLALAAGLGALSKFLQSDLFQKLKDTIIPALATALEAVGDALTWIYENILKPLYLYLEENLPKVIQTFSDFFTWLGPKITFLYDEYLSPILGIFQTAFIDTWANIKTLFTDLGDSFKSFEEDGLWKTISNVFLDIGKFVGKQIDLATTAMYNVIATVFGLEETDSVFGSIKGFFSNIYDTTVTFVADTFQAIKDAIFGSFTWVADTTMTGATWLSDLVTGVYEDIKSFFVGAFTWVSDTTTAGVDFITNLVSTTFGNIKDFFTGAFTWMGTSVSEGSEWLTTLVDKGLIEAYEVVKKIFSTENLTVENFTSMFGNLFDMVTAPIKVAFDSIKSIFSPMDAAETEKLKNEYSILDMLKGIVKDVFNWFKSDIFSFSFDEIKLPEIPDLGKVLTDVFNNVLRAILKPIINFTDPFFGSQPVRFALSKFAKGQNLIDFADQTGDYTPARPASTVTPFSDPIYGEAGRGGTTIIQSSAFNNRQGDNFAFASGITNNAPGLREASNSYG